MKKVLVILFAVVAAIILVACGGAEAQPVPPPSPPLVMETTTSEERTAGTDVLVNENGEDEAEYDNSNSALVEGLYFEISDMFIVESITELTQYHLGEDWRNDPDIIYRAEYYMDEPVLFIPISITTIEISGESDYRLRPELRAWTPSGRRSIFEADTLNGRHFFQLAASDILNYEGAISQGYLAFIWDGYGEYRAEIRWGSEVVEEFVFDVNNNNVIRASEIVGGHDVIGTQGQPQDEIDEAVVTMVNNAIASIESTFASVGIFEYAVEFDRNLDAVVVNLWRDGFLLELVYESEEVREDVAEILVDWSNSFKRIVDIATNRTDIHVVLNLLNDLNLDNTIIAVLNGTITFNALDTLD